MKKKNWKEKNATSPFFFSFIYLFIFICWNHLHLSSPLLQEQTPNSHTMAESTEIVNKGEDPKAPKNIFSLLPKFKLEFPFLKPNPPNTQTTTGKDEVKTKVVVDDDGGIGNESQKPNVVRYPKRELVVPPPLEVEAEESGTSNPVILWQVYALGGFIVLRWIWAKWNERRAQGKSSDDERKAQGEQSDDDRSSDVE
ncbi:Dihydrolipoamide acetyltransferase component of pyruvate dehydrogenase complex [Quillaja saponaria]|uniref:Dihydrolipoamide acetyltransferase component of pyruvate dehydrogenase complex n=1 Tax=Quillaja saponaria TaxID=32244 RepID=A0AAD7Q4Y3_QUISA|nr:Dihydrolipoamide acetyltransferase component of pyruvate dehydrogenase complex [Quillaja saponaria]